MPEHAVMKIATIERKKRYMLPAQPLQQEGKVMRLFRKVTGVKRRVEPQWIDDSRFQDVLAAGPRFVYRRLKAAFRRGELVVIRGKVVPS